MENDKRYYYIPIHNIYSDAFSNFEFKYEEVKGVMGYDKDKELLHRTYSRYQIGGQGGLRRPCPHPVITPRALAQNVDRRRR